MTAITRRRLADHPLDTVRTEKPNRLSVCGIESHTHLEVGDILHVNINNLSLPERAADVIKESIYSVLALSALLLSTAFFPSTPF